MWLGRRPTMTWTLRWRPFLAWSAFVGWKKKRKKCPKSQNTILWYHLGWSKDVESLWRKWWLVDLDGFWTSGRGSCVDASRFEWLESPLPARPYCLASDFIFKRENRWPHGLSPIFFAPHSYIDIIISYWTNHLIFRSPREFPWFCYVPAGHNVFHNKIQSLPTHFPTLPKFPQACS